jgi:predicted PurR-regulated permease PerM
MMDSDRQFYLRVFWVAAAALLALGLFEVLRPFFESIVWSVLLAFLLKPVNDRLTRKVGGRRGLAAIVLTVAGFLFVLAPIGMLAVVFGRQAAELIGHLQALAERYKVSQTSDLWNLPIVHRVLGWLNEFLPVDTTQLQAAAIDATKSLLGLFVTTSGSLFASALGTLFSMLMTLFLIFFFLRDWDVMVAATLRLVPLDPRRKESLVAHIAAVTRGVALGSMVTAAVQGALVGIAFLLVGLPSVVVFGVLAAVAALLPVPGTAAVWVPAAIVLFAQGRMGAAVFMLLWGGLVVVGMSDSFIRPAFVSGQAEMSTLPVFLGLMGGIGAFGAVGIVVGPVLVAIALALLRFAAEAGIAGRAQ